MSALFSLSKYKYRSPSFNSYLCYVINNNIVYNTVNFKRTDKGPIKRWNVGYYNPERGNYQEKTFP